jgi:hypothetical protein
VRRESHAEPHIVHWGMKIDFLRSFSCLHGREMMFFFLFCRMCARHVEGLEQKKFIYHQVFFLPIDETRKRREKKMKESNKHSFFLLLAFVFASSTILLLLLL